MVCSLNLKLKKALSSADAPHTKNILFGVGADHRNVFGRSVRGDHSVEWVAMRPTRRLTRSEISGVMESHSPFPSHPLGSGSHKPSTITKSGSYLGPSRFLFTGSIPTSFATRVFSRREVVKTDSGDD